MSVLIFLTGLVVTLNCIPFLTRRSFPETEKVVARILVVAAILFLSLLVFEFNGYKLKGHYSFSIISWAFIISCVVFFVLFKNTKKKIISVLLLTPLIGLCLMVLVVGRVTYKNKIDETNTVSVTTGGLLACGENISISQTRFGIFDKQVFYFDNQCIVGIYKIETVKLDNKHAEFLIYHDGKYDSENPIKYDVERKTGW